MSQKSDEKMNQCFELKALEPGYDDHLTMRQADLKYAQVKYLT